MSRIISILLLLIIGVGTFGIPLAFKIRQARIHRSVRSQVRRGLSADQLHMFNATDPEIEWKDKDKEFSYRGEMYDVVSVKVEDGVKTWYCLSDKEEKELNRMIARTVEDRNGLLSGNLAKSLFNFLMQGFLPVDLWQPGPGHPITKKIHPDALCAGYKQIIKPVNEPPPWLG